MKPGIEIQILAPVNGVNEVAPLLESGAHCLYGGCLPEGWRRRYPGTVLLNQRTFASAQFSSLEDLSRAVSAAREAGRGFALTLNAPFYMEEQISLVLDLAARAASMGVTGFIVADPGLLRLLAGEDYGVPLHLSTMGLATNAAAVDFYRGLGVTRIILPRLLTVADIRNIVMHFPNVEYEAFILVGKCPNVEGICSFRHDDPGQRWPCEWEYTTGEDEDGSEMRHYLGRLAAADRRQACGLCALPMLAEAGVGTFKIVGRGAPLEQKLTYVRALADALRRMPAAVDADWISRCRQEYRRIYGRGCTAQDCYYPEAVER